MKYEPTSRELKGMLICARVFSFFDWFWIYFKVNTIGVGQVDREIEMRIKSRGKR